MDNKKNISFFGFSSVAALTSLLLADKGIENSFYVESLTPDFEEYPGISSSIINYRSQLLEQKFLDPDILNKVLSIKGYDYRWYDSSFNLTMQLKGNYKFPVYAIDNRLRYQSYFNAMKDSKKIKIEELDERMIETQPLESEIKIIGGGGRYSHLFKNLEGTQGDTFNKERKLFYFDLECTEKILTKYVNGKALIIDEYGYFFIYPSYYKTRRNVLTIVVCVNRFQENSILNENLFFELIEVIRKCDKETAFDLKECHLIEDKSIIINMLPYFKYPLSKNNALGIGNSILKTNPITAKGFNEGMNIADKLVDLLLHYSNTKDIPVIIQEFTKYASECLKNMYYLNLAFTEKYYSNCIDSVFASATKNKKLQDFIIAETLEDTSLYFPWLINEDEAKNTIKNFA